MKYSISFYLDGPNIYLYVTWASERLRKSTGKRILKKDWVEENKKGKVQRANPANPLAQEINGHLNKIESSLKSFFDTRRTVPTKIEVENIISVKKDYEETFTGLFEKFIKDSETGIRVTSKGKKIKPLTIKSYKQTLSVVKQFAEEKKYPLTWERINDKFYYAFTSWLWDDQDYYDNAVGSRIRVLKTFLNWCNSEGHIKTKVYSKNWITWEEEIDIVVLYPDELDLLFQIELTDRLERARDIFIAGCMTCLRVGNLLNLTPEDYAGGKLKVISLKIDKPIHIEVNPMLAKIFQKYNLLPDISEQKFNDALKDLAKAFKKHIIDKEIKLVGNDWNKPFIRTRRKRGAAIKQRMDMEEMITSHTMRRTGITYLLMMGLSMPEVMAISGHALNSKEFSKYVKIAEQFIAKKSIEAWDKRFKAAI